MEEMSSTFLLTNTTYLKDLHTGLISYIFVPSLYPSGKHSHLTKLSMWEFLITSVWLLDYGIKIWPLNKMHWKVILSTFPFCLPQFLSRHFGHNVGVLNSYEVKGFA